ncbi:MAG: Type 1 glutamine amidotransferase-like domain-containing protein [Chloroflexota bacterium]
MHFKKRFFATVILTMMAFSVIGAGAQDNVKKVFMPIGGGYGDTYDAFIAAALNSKVGDTLKIVVLPSTYATSADKITDDERQENLDAAENRRSQIEDSCKADVPASVTCDVQLTPIFTRDDALNPDNVAFFTDDVGAVYILGGDQTIAMQVMVNTPVEEALAKAYDRGALIAGTSAGEAVQSKVMLGGYLGDYGPETGLNEGAVDIWNSGDKRGLSFGIADAIFEQHFWERARLGRLMNVLAQPGVPPVGLGIDSYTAATITDSKTLSNVAGLYSIGILDAQTFDAAKSATFRSNILSMHNVLFHILPPGDFTYDLDTHETSIAPSLKNIKRTFDDLKAPAGAGRLILSGNLETFTANASVLAHFVELSQGDNAKICVALFADTDEASNTLLQTYTPIAQSTTSFVNISITPGTTPEAKVFDSCTGIMVLASDVSKVDASKLMAIKTLWLAGTPLLLDNAAAAIAGTFFSAQGPTPEATDAEPYADIDYIQGAFIDGSTNIQSGLGLLNITVEARTLADYRVGRMVALGYAHPDTLAIGLNDASALEINQDGASVLGTNGVFVLDLRQATLDKGTNDGFAFANGLLDSFAPGDTIK